MTTPKRIRVVVVDDHSLFRRGVVDAITDDPDSPVEVVAEADDVESGLAAVCGHRPDVALIDIQLPSGSGAEIVAGARERLGPDSCVRYLALSVSERPDDVLAMIRAGAQGYVTKRIEASDLVATIDQVAAGGVVFSPRLAGVVLNELGGIAPAANQLDASHTLDGPVQVGELGRLSPREREVLQHLARGYTYREIGAALHISARTVESHTASVLRKLQLSNRHALTHWAVRNNVV